MKKFLLLLTAAITAMSLSSAPVDQATAQRKAKSFLTQHMYAGKTMSASALNPVLVKTEMGSAKINQPVYYIYNTSTTFLVIAGDDRAEEILMIGDRPLKDVNNLPPGMLDMLRQYKEEISFLQENPNLKVAPIVSPENTPMLRATNVGPLLTANWDQQEPYYNQCVFKYNNRNYQCLTGCPATSASMVLYFWKYPTTPTGNLDSYQGYLDLSSGYTSNEVSFTYPALSSTTFDWANMRDDYTGEYTTAEGNAVATLMRYVGQAEQMIYGPNGSGISVDDAQHVADMFIRFGYDATTTRLVKQYEKMDNSGNVSGRIYTDAQWAAMIQEEMAAGRPIVFMAVDLSNGGHAFNVDGYRSSDNKYHINFGWSGEGNDWCALNAFGYTTSSGWWSTSYNFNTYQQMIIGIQPPSTATPELTVNPTSLSFTGQTGETYTKTFTVTGTDLRGDVNVSSNSGVFAVSPTTITAAQAAAGATVTVTYIPTTAGTQNGTITISSSAAEDKTVTVTGTATSVPKLVADPSTLNFNTVMGTPVTQSFMLTGLNLTGDVDLSVSGAEFTINKTHVDKANASAGAVVTVTYFPTVAGTHTGTVTITSADCADVTVALNGVADIVKAVPVMLPANEEYINLTKFRADWTDATPDENVASYTLEVNGKPEVVELLGSIDGTSYTNQSYQAVTLSAPWSGNNVYGGYGAIYFRNATHQSATTDGYIKFTIPAGYQNQTFTVKITTASGQYGSGRFVVGSNQTAAVEYNMSATETHSWLVTGNSGEVITVTSPENQYSPDIALIEVYAGDATAATLNATRDVDPDYRLIEGITEKFFTVEDLTAEGTFLYKVKAIYIDGTESEWSNIEEVTLFENGHGYEVGDVNHDGKLNISDVTALTNYLLTNGEGDGCAICGDMTGDGNVTIADVTALINYLLTHSN